MKAGHSNDLQVLENVPVNTVVLTLVTTRYTEAFKHPQLLLGRLLKASLFKRCEPLNYCHFVWFLCL